MGLDKMQSLNETHQYNPCDVKTHCLCAFFIYFFPSPQVLLMQESVRRIIEAEESRMGKISNILVDELILGVMFFKQAVKLFHSLAL